MGKAKISRRQEISSRKRRKKIEAIKGLKRSKPLEYLTNEKNVGAAILNCLQNNDPEGVMEVIAIYLDALNTSKLLKEGKLSKSTFYYSLKNKNPTVKTLAKIVYSFTQSEAA